MAFRAVRHWVTRGSTKAVGKAGKGTARTLGKAAGHAAERPGRRVARRGLKPRTPLSRLIRHGRKGAKGAIPHVGALDHGKGVNPAKEALREGVQGARRVPGQAARAARSGGAQANQAGQRAAEALRGRDGSDGAHPAGGGKGAQVGKALAAGGAVLAFGAARTGARMTSHTASRTAAMTWRWSQRLVPGGRVVGCLVSTVVLILAASGFYVIVDNMAAGEARADDALALVELCHGQGGVGVSQTSAAGVPGDMDTDTVLAALREIESNGRYQAQSHNSDASGAYQFIRTTWNNYGGYDEAYLAPPAVQDTRAEEHVHELLDRYDQHWTVVVPVGWNPGPGHLPAPPDDDPWWNSDEDADANGVTPGEYRQRFLDAYAELSGGAPSGAAGYDPQGLCGGGGAGMFVGDLSCPPGVEPVGGTERVTEPGRVTDATQAMLDALVPCFGRINGIGCFSPRDGTGNSRPVAGSRGLFEHPRGRACDLMTSCGGCTTTGDAKRHGDALAEWLRANAEELNVIQVIWYREIWSKSAADAGWRPYSGDSPHVDHVHVSIDLMPGDPDWAVCPLDLPCTPYRSSGTPGVPQ